MSSKKRIPPPDTSGSIRFSHTLSRIEEFVDKVCQGANAWPRKKIPDEEWAKLADAGDAFLAQYDRIMKL